MKKISLYRPTITKNDLVSVLNCLVEEQISDQAITIDFERKFSQMIKAKNNVIAVNHVSSALYLIFKLLKLNPGDEIILSPLADYFILEVIQIFQLNPIWIDLELGTLQMNPAEIGTKLTDRTKAVIITHHLGYPFDMKNLEEFNLASRGVKVIEDNTAALGSQRKISSVQKNSQEVESERWLGLDGDFSFFCFDSHRMLTTAKGGMIVTKTKSDAKNIRSLRSYNEPIHKKEKGMAEEVVKAVSLKNNDEIKDNDESRNELSRLDFSLSNLNAALGISEIFLFEKFIKRRQEIRKYFVDVLMKSRHSFVAEDEGVLPNGYVFPAIFSSGKATAKELFDKGKIEVAGFDQGTIYATLPYNEELKVINELNLNLLQIPNYPTLKVDEIDRIAKILASVP